MMVHDYYELGFGCKWPQTVKQYIRTTIYSNGYKITYVYIDIL